MVTKPAASIALASQLGYSLVNNKYSLDLLTAPHRSITTLLYYYTPIQLLEYYLPQYHVYRVRERHMDQWYGFGVV